MEKDKRGYDFAPPAVMNFIQHHPAVLRFGTVTEKKSAPQIGCPPRSAPPPLPGAPWGTGPVEGGAV
eukprot:1546348-Heterocapsa_arctica.AAC.1